MPLKDRFSIPRFLAYECQATPGQPLSRDQFIDLSYYLVMEGWICSSVKNVRWDHEWNWIEFSDYFQFYYGFNPSSCGMRHNFIRKPVSISIEKNETA